MSVTETRPPDRWRDTGPAGARPGKGVRKVLAIVPAAMVAVALLPLGQAGGQVTTAPVAVMPDAASSTQTGGQQATLPVVAKSAATPSTSSQVVPTPAPATTDHATDCAENHSGEGSEVVDDCAGDGSGDGTDHSHVHAEGDGTDHSHADGDHAHAKGADHAADCAANHSGSSSGDATDCA